MNNNVNNGTVGVKEEAFDLDKALSSLKSQIDERKKVILKKYLGLLGFIQNPINDKKISIRDLVDLRASLGAECRKLIQSSISSKIQEISKHQGFDNDELAYIEEQCILVATQKFEKILSMDSIGYPGFPGTLGLDSVQNDVTMPKIFSSSGNTLPTKDQTCDDLYQLLELVGLLVVQKQLNFRSIGERVKDDTFQLTQLAKVA